MHAGGLEVINSTPGPLLFLLLPGEVRELTCREEILIVAPSNETNCTCQSNCYNPFSFE